MLPDQWQVLLRGTEVALVANQVLTEEITLDLFEHPGPVKYAKEALSLRRQAIRVEEIARRLGTTPRTTYDAIKLAEMMEERGLLDPYMELSEPPVKASRWHRGI